MCNEEFDFECKIVRDICVYMFHTFLKAQVRPCYSKIHIL